MLPLAGTPSEDMRLEVMNDLLQNILEEPAYAYLRTKETLGYTVDLYCWVLSETTGQTGLAVRVDSQANKFDSNLVAGYIYAFWYRIVPFIIFHLKQEVFQTLIETMISSNLLDDATMDVEVGRNKTEIFSDRPVFDRRQRAVMLPYPISFSQ